MNAVEDLQKWLKFGLSAEQEDRFRQANFGADIAQSRIFVLLVILPFIALLANDYGFFGLTRTFYGLLTLRLAFTAYTILFLKSLREFPNYSSYDRAEFFWGIFLAFANAVINATRPENFVAHTIITVLAVFVIVLAIPNRFTNQVIAALVYTIAQTLIIVPSLRVSPQASFVVLLSMLMVNAIAITSSWLLHFWRRREFLTREKIEKTRAEIETQLTERKKVEEALREIETLLTTFLEQLPVGAGLFDPQGRWLISNSLLSDLVSDSIPSRDSENSWRWRTWGADGRLIKQSEWPGARALRGENVTPGLDFLYTSDDGREIWTRVSSVPFRNKAGEITGVITVIQDIDKQKRAEEALKRSEKGLAEAQRIAHLGNWDRNLATGKLYWSDELYRIFGLKPQEFEMTYDIFLDYVHPEDRDYLDKAVKKALNGGSFDINYRIVSANGEERVVHSQSEVVFNEKNTPVRIRGIIQDITEHIRAEERIQHLADVVESSDDSIFSLSLEGIITSWNRGAEQVYGYSAEEILGKNGSIFEPENLKGEIKKLIERVKNNEKIRYYETLRLRKDGALVNVSITLSPVFSSSGELVAVSTIARDITERKRADEALRKSEERFRALVTASSEVIYRMSPDWRCMNRLCGRGFLADTENLNPAWLQEYILPEDQPYVTAVINEAIRTKSIFELEHRVRQADGSIGWTFSRAVPLLDKNGEIIEWFGAASDITERKLAEETLRQSELLYRSIGELIPYGIWETNTEGGVIYLSQSFLDMIGKSLDEVMEFGWLDHYPPEKIPKFLDDWKRTLAEGTDWHYEHPIRDKNGEWKTILSRGFPMRDESGKITTWAGINLDITERKQAEEALAKIDIARQREIHHRIKNNLQVISSLLDLTAERFNNRECIKDSEVLKAFRESQDRVISMALIHEELYKGEEFETLNFSPYIEELAENLLQTYVVGNLDINLKMDLEENAFFDMDTAVPLGIIVNELVSNSLKHAFPGRNEGEIRIELHKEENGECTKSINEDCKITNFVLTVSDNGVGIPENFDMENLDTLGMQLVTSLVGQLDGEFELKRVNGTEFTVRFTVIEKINQESAPASQ
ncbi:PAS domain S-box protein [Methanosarcina sp.]|uniref:PAS domain S-box protein n=1 Tax=Methanosarcina sp. TaxID=2213 RepID=UPI003C7520D3